MHIFFSFVCQEGYTLVGYANIEWIDDEWSYPAPTCIGK